MAMTVSPSVDLEGATQWAEDFLAYCVAVATRSFTFGSDTPYRLSDVLDVCACNVIT